MTVPDQPLAGPQQDSAAEVPLAEQVTAVGISVPVPERDRARLEAVLGLSDVTSVLDALLRAGAMESLAYATGGAVFSSMSELRMFRVACLVNAGLPIDKVEQLVASLFKLTPAGARRIVAASFARYPVELRGSADGAVKEQLGRAALTADEEWEVRLPPGFVRDRVLSMCRESDQPDPKPKYGAIWLLPQETFVWLRAQLGMPQPPVPPEGAGERPGKAKRSRRG
ncbi:hypothetical protein [Nocardioides ochotonae]|uniref:hypothetical protein n=1 Tax=Nocardioides ochotonae TaxID=2685869 RepID=UPI00140B4E1E|nr:hypothetical protein [Nocardioides ochotonae]